MFIISTAGPVPSPMLAGYTVEIPVIAQSIGSIYGEILWLKLFSNDIGSDAYDQTVPKQSLGIPNELVNLKYRFLMPNRSVSFHLYLAQSSNQSGPWTTVSAWPDWITVILAEQPTFIEDLNCVYDDIYG